MSATDRPFEAYVYAIREQTEQHIAGLDELAEQLAQRPLTFNERNAAERGLQVLVEMAIGCAKHLLKSRSKPVPSEARAAIERVYELLAIAEPPVALMRGAVGMRNAITHDYLNIDWRLLAAVLDERNYRAAAQFIDAVAAELLQQ